jgi:hypothetical protein
LERNLETKDQDIVLVSSSTDAPSMPTQNTVSVLPKKNPRGAGRPKKAAIEAKKKRSVLGRPPGEAARIREFHARLLTTKGDTIIQTIINKALDPTDKDQAAMLKMCADRLLPLSYFEKHGSASKAGITINISGVGDAKIEADQTIDAEDVDYESGH